MPNGFRLPNSHRFNRMNAKGATEPTLASDLHSTPANKNIGFPGWPEHNLDCVLVLGGQLTEGGLHRPPFLFFMARTSRSIASFLAVARSKRRFTHHVRPNSYYIN